MTIPYQTQAYITCVFTYARVVHAHTYLHMPLQCPPTCILLRDGWSQSESSSQVAADRASASSLYYGNTGEEKAWQGQGMIPTVGTNAEHALHAPRKSETEERIAVCRGNLQCSQRKHSDSLTAECSKTLHAFSGAATTKEERKIYATESDPPATSNGLASNIPAAKTSRKRKDRELLALAQGTASSARRFNDSRCSLRLAALA